MFSLGLGVWNPSAVSAQDKDKHSHAIALKEFHQGLQPSLKDSTLLTEADTKILESAVGAFLASEQHEVLLELAFLTEKSIHLEVEQEEPESRNSSEPAEVRALKTLADKLKENIPTSIEIKPLDRQSEALQIMVQKGTKGIFFHVHWSGEITNSFNRTLASNKTGMAWADTLAVLAGSS